MPVKHGIRGSRRNPADFQRFDSIGDERKCPDRTRLGIVSRKKAKERASERKRKVESCRESPGRERERERRNFDVMRESRDRRRRGTASRFFAPSADLFVLLVTEPIERLGPGE